MTAQNDPRASVVLLLGAKNGATGTAFSIRRVGDQTWLLTCAHVVEDLGGADMIRVKLGDRKLSVTQIACGSADAVDLALLAVQGLALPPLSLHPDGKTDEACRIPGFAEVDKHYGAQPLKATLRDWFPLETREPRVRAWPLRITDDVELASGYSGAPVLRADSAQVLAVTTHKEYAGERGYAIDIGELPKVYPRAAAFLVASEAEPAHEYATESDAPLVKIFDHTDQLPALHDLLRASDRSIALVTACAEDWPSYLGDHLHLDPWPDQDRGFEEAVMLPPPRYDARALWQALIDAAPGARLALDDPGRIGAVRD